MSDMLGDRQQQILAYLEQNKTARVKELSDLLGVSEMTIRRDLQVLDQKRLLIKTHGGAVQVERPLSQEVPYDRKLHHRIDEKRRIAAAAAKMVSDGDTILLDAGSTTLAMAQALTGLTRVTVITNDVQIALQLAHKPGISLVVAGGMMHDDVYTLMGPSTEGFLNSIHVDKTFLGADGVDLKAGVTNRTLLEVSVKQAMIRAAREPILLCDSGKFGHRVFAKVCDLDQISTIITDNGLSPEEAKQYAEFVPRFITV